MKYLIDLIFMVCLGSIKVYIHRTYTIHSPIDQISPAYYLTASPCSGLKVRFPSLLQLSVLFNVTIREHDLFSFLNRQEDICCTKNRASPCWMGGGGARDYSIFYIQELHLFPLPPRIKVSNFFFNNFLWEWVWVWDCTSTNLKRLYWQ